jgi:prolyl-tRNA synthetase
MEEHTHRDIETYDKFTAFFTPKNTEKPEIHGGFVIAKWCGNNACEEKCGEINVTIRCLPFEQSGTEGRCVICGGKAKTDAVFAKAY